MFASGRLNFNNEFSSPSVSPDDTMFSRGMSLDSGSECLSPISPPLNKVGHTRSTPYESQQYNLAPTNFYPTHNTSVRIPVEIVSSTLDDKYSRRKRGDATNSGTSDQDTVPSTHLRRRAQNRASQRAFRERKEKHVKGLEHQLEELHEKHQDLLQSYSKQVVEVSRLHARVAQLSAELNIIRNFQDPALTEMMLPAKFDRFDKFDAFSSSDMLYTASDGFYNKADVTFPADFSLHPFEDSL